MMTQKQQDAAAHRQLRDRGVSDARIAHLDRKVASHVKRQARIANGMTGAVLIGWCDEHKRYFKWPIGCSKLDIPTNDEVRENYASIRFNTGQ